MSEWNKNPEWTPKENINDGNQYSPNDTIDADDFNALIENIQFLYNYLSLIGNNKLGQLVRGIISEVSATDLAGAESIKDYTFYNCKQLAKAVIPEGVKTIGKYAFYGCSSLDDLTLPNTIDVIEANAFDHCTDLLDVVIPNATKTLGRGAFYYCTKLQNVTIGDGITSIEDSVFYGCSSLSSVTIYAKTPPTIQSNTFGEISSYCKRYVPAESVELYKSDTNWSAYADRIFAIEE